MISRPCPLHRHNYSYALNFADGHSAIWRYSDPRSFQPIVNKTEQPGNADLARLARATANPEMTPRAGCAAWSFPCLNY